MSRRSVLLAFGEVSGILAGTSGFGKKSGVKSCALVRSKTTQHIRFSNLEARGLSNSPMPKEVFAWHSMFARHNVFAFLVSRGRSAYRRFLRSFSSRSLQLPPALIIAALSFAEPVKCDQIGIALCAMHQVSMLLPSVINLSTLLALARHNEQFQTQRIIEPLRVP